MQSMDVIFCGIIMVSIIEQVRSGRSLGTLHTEVLVVGAGAAGVTAALAAARNGSKTILVESQGYVGGISAMLPWLGFHDRDYRMVVKGIALELAVRLQTMGGASEFCLDPKCGSAISIDGHLWKCLAMQWLDETGVRLMLHTQMIDTIREGERIVGVTIAHKSGIQDIRASVVIDCSGDGDVAAKGGVAWEKGRLHDGLVQSPTLVFKLAGVNRSDLIRACRDKSLNYREWIAGYPDLWEKMMGRLDKLPVFVFGGFASLVEQARRQGDFDLPQTRVIGVKLHQEDQFLAVMTRMLGLDPTDIDSISSAYAGTYHQVPTLVGFFRKYVPGFENAYLLEIAPMLGIRESRRIVGDYMLTAQDLVAGRRFDDAVAMGGYHIDIHRPSGTWVESQNVLAYTIPYRSLIAGDVEGLLMAGKCISATHEAIASTRVIPICMAQGQAVGTAAALAVRHHTALREVDIRELQGLLVHQGSEIGSTLEPPNQQAIDEIGQLPMEEDQTVGEKDEASRMESAWIASHDSK